MEPSSSIIARIKSIKVLSLYILSSAIQMSVKGIRETKEKVTCGKCQTNHTGSHTLSLQLGI